MTKKCQSENPLFKIIVSEDTNLAEQGDASYHLGEREKYPKETQSESILNKSSENKVKERKDMAVGVVQKPYKRGFLNRKAPNPYLRKLAPINLDKKCTLSHERHDSIRIKELHNKLFEVKAQLEETQKENVQLKTMQKRQEVEIKKLEDTKAEMPRMMKTYQEELRIMTIKFKDLKMTNRELERKIKQKDDEIISLKLQNSHLVKLTKDRNLLEREKLMKKVQQLESHVNNLEDVNKKLAKKCDLEEKRMNAILKLEVTKHKETKNHLQQALKSIEVLQGRNTNINYITTQPKKVVPPKIVEDIPPPSLIKQRSKSGPKIERKSMPNTSSVERVEIPQKLSLPMIQQESVREIPKQEMTEIKIKERPVQPVENTPNQTFPDIEIIENNQNGDIFSVDNLDWDEIKKYVHPRKEELIVKIENMFAKEETQRDDLCDFEFDDQVNEFMPSVDVENKSRNSSTHSQFFGKQSSTDSEGVVTKKSTREIDSGSDSKKSSIAAILNLQTNPFEDQTRIKKDNGVLETTNDDLFKNEQEFNQSKTKKNKNADILKYIFGKELLFEVNPE